MINVAPPRACCGLLEADALKMRAEEFTYFVIATAMSYTGKRRSRNKYFPISVSAAAESIASLPTRFRSKYGVASRPCNK